MNNFDLMRYGSNALLSYVGIMAYDVLVEGRSVNEAFVMNDASTFAIANIASNVAFDLVSGFIPLLNDNSLINMLSKPILNAIVYMYLYDTMVSKKYPYYRDDTKALYVGAIGNLLVGYLENPIASLFGIKHY